MEMKSFLSGLINSQRNLLRKAKKLVTTR